jgi:hypothetical protein
VWNSCLKWINHLSLVEVVDQRIEQTITERLARHFQPPLRHHEKRCTRCRIGGRSRYLEAFSRHGPETIFSLPHVTNPPVARNKH